MGRMILSSTWISGSDEPVATIARHRNSSFSSRFFQDHVSPVGQKVIGKTGGLQSIVESLHVLLASKGLRPDRIAVT